MDPRQDDPYAQPLPTHDTETRLLLKVGTLIGKRFRILRQIGAGGMGVVYVAADATLLPPGLSIDDEAAEVPAQAMVALKIINPEVVADDDLRRDFIREVNNARRLTDRHIIRVFEPHEMDGKLLFTMEWLDGHNLATELKAHPDGLGVARARRLLHPVAEALAYAHRQGVIHRDLSPKNVFIEHPGDADREQAKLIDFGIAHFLAETASTHGASRENAVRATAGTDPYMSPERFTGAKADPRDDVYGFAAVTYEAVTGRRPFHSGAIYQRPESLLPEKPEGLAQTAWERLRTGLAYRRDERAADPRELTQGLDANAPAPPPSPIWQKAAIVAGALSAAVLAIVLMWPNPTPTDDAPPVGAGLPAKPAAGAQPPVGAASAAREPQAERSRSQPIAAEAAPTEDGAAELEKQRQALEAQRQAQEAERARLAKLAEETEAKRRAQEDAGKRLAEQNAEAERKVREAEAERTRLEQARAEAEQRKREAQARRERDDGAWTKAKSANTRESYATYLTGCGADGCGHEAEARRAQAALPVKYTLTVRSNVDGDRVYVDGEAKGSTRLDLNLEGGRSYRVRVEKDGYEAWEQTVGLDGATTVWAELKAKEVPRQGYEPEMVKIPAGRYTIGSPSGEEGRLSDEGPQHELRVGAFGLMKHELSVEEYAAFLNAAKPGEAKRKEWVETREEDATANHLEKVGGMYRAQAGYERHPVNNVSWHGAVAYAEWLSKETGKRYRLPTEAEWEYAARAGTTGSFNFGGISAAKANYDANYQYAGSPKGEYRKDTTAAGTFAGYANAWELEDMHGNVWEWTCSAYDGEGYKQGQNGPHTQCGETAPDGRALRGGSWFNVPRRLRSANRFRHTADSRNSHVGFRLAQDL